MSDKTVHLTLQQERTSNQKELQRGLDVVISTPGRLIDLVTKSFLTLDSISCLMIDEFDKMLDSTFWPQLNFINSLLPCPSLCQRALFSASFARKVRPFVDQIFNHSNKEKIYASIKECEQAIGFETKVDSYSLLILGKLNRVREEVNEKFVIVKNDGEKEHWLHVNLRELVTHGKIIIFVNQKKRALEVQGFLMKNLNLKVPCIYGDMYTVERHQVLETFRKESDVLISTDVLGRGIDVKEVQ